MVLSEAAGCGRRPGYPPVVQMLAKGLKYPRMAAYKPTAVEWLTGVYNSHASGAATGAAIPNNTGRMSRIMRNFPTETEDIKHVD